MNKLIRYLTTTLALCAALSWAPAARAATWYVSPSGSDVATDGTTTPFRTIAKAVDTLAAGDVVRLLPSDTAHVDGLDLRVGQSKNTFTVRGDTAAPNKVKLNSISLLTYPGAVNLNSVTVEGVRVGTVSLRRVFNGTLNGFQLRNSVVTTSFYGEDCGPRVTNCRFGTDSSSFNWRVTGLYMQPEPTVIVNCSFKLRTTDTGSPYLFGLWAEDVENLPLLNCSMSASDVTITLTVPISKTTFLRGLRGFTSSGNKWTYRDSSGTDNAGQGYLLRDAIVQCSFLNDTLEVLTVRSGSSSLWAQIIGSGSLIPGRDNVWKHCRYRSNLPINSETYGAFYVWQFQPRDSFYYNTVICSTGVTNSGFHVNGAAGRAYLLNNTFVNMSGGGAARLYSASGSDCQGWVGPVVFANNIMYTKSTSTTTTGYAARMKWKAQHVLYSNYNLYAHYGGTAGSRSIYGSSNCNPTNFLFGVGAASSLCASSNRECASLYGSPVFADTLFATFDPTLGATSAARGAGDGGADIGAHPYGGFDTDAPAQITDLNVIYVTPGAASLEWTSPGDDGSTGTANAYDLRYATYEITADNFASASYYPAPVPSVAGSLQSVTVQGLGSNTQYYFVLRARDEANNWSVISDIASARTLNYPGEGGPPTEEP